MEKILLLNKFFPIVDTCLSCEDIARQICGMVPRWRLFGDFLRAVFSPSCVQHVSDLHAAQATFVLDGDPATLPKSGRSPLPIFAHFYCDQTAGCIKMPLGMEVGLGPGDFVLDGDPSRPLNFRPMFIISLVIVISLEHCTLVIGLFKFKF